MAVGTSIGHLLPTRFEVQIASKCIGRFSEPGRLPVAQHLGPVAANAHQAALDANEVASAPRAAAKPFDAPFPRAWISAVAIFFVPGFKSLPDALTRQIEQAGPTFPEGRGITAADLERVALVDLTPEGMAICGIPARAGVVAPCGQLLLRPLPILQPPLGAPLVEPWRRRRRWRRGRLRRRRRG